MRCVGILWVLVSLDGKRGEVCWEKWQNIAFKLQSLPNILLCFVIPTPNLTFIKNWPKACEADKIEAICQSVNQFHQPSSLIACVCLVDRVVPFSASNVCYDLYLHVLLLPVLVEIIISYWTRQHIMFLFFFFYMSSYFHFSRDKYFFFLTKRGMFLFFFFFFWEANYWISIIEKG